MIKRVLNRFFNGGPWISEEPPELDDAREFGILADDIARRTGIHPGAVKRELDKMVAFGNPLAIKFTERALAGDCVALFSSEFNVLCKVIDERVRADFSPAV